MSRAVFLFVVAGLIAACGGTSAGDKESRSHLVDLNDSWVVTIDEAQQMGHDKKRQPACADRCAGVAELYEFAGGNLADLWRC